MEYAPLSKEKIGSKDKIQVINTLGDILQEYTVIVPGDVTGNGLIQFFDVFKILDDADKGNDIDEIDTEIEDHNGDGEVKLYDAVQYFKEMVEE